MAEKQGSFEEELKNFEMNELETQDTNKRKDKRIQKQYNLQISIESADFKDYSESNYKEGLQNSVIRRLKRGAIPFFMEVDLHGLRFDEAIEVLNETINQVTENKMVCILFIHGKGLGSINKTPVIKPLVKKFLSEHPRVLAYTPANRKDGGEGATMALIKKVKNS